ncbi:hypothetical protein ABZ419_18540 [Streptomyces cinnamoneus]|uniref:hypothetical protein n=1 Tax=Streptomyces cinnamoneus TaxID=53446 RepID=UPI0033F2A289
MDRDVGHPMKKALVPLSILCGALAVGAAAFLFLLPPDGSAKPGDLVGSWRSSQGAELILRDDGSLTAVGVPTEFSDDDEPVEPFTGKGTWSLDPKRGFGDQEVHLSLGEVFGSKSGVQLQIQGKGAKDGLAIPLSMDTGKKFIFKRSS